MSQKSLGLTMLSSCWCTCRGGKSSTVVRKRYRSRESSIEGNDPLMPVVSSLNQELAQEATSSGEEGYSTGTDEEGSGGEGDESRARDFYAMYFTSPNSRLPLNHPDHDYSFQGDYS